MKSIFLLLLLVVAFGCNSTETVYVGTGSPDGMFRIDVDMETGAMVQVYQQADVKQPGFLAFSPDDNTLYCVAGGNKLRSYRIEEDLSLTFLNEVNSTGSGPCHIAVSKSGKAVVAANYGSGDTTVVSVDEEGKFVGEPRNHSHTTFKASGISKRQEGPHAHNVYMSPDGKYAFVADLGLDKVVIYKFDENLEKLSLNNPQFVSVPVGSGPRHFTFHPNEKFAYVINELNSTLTAFHYNGYGELAVQETVSTKPADWTKDNNCADIHIHPNGKFLYGSNRGNNSIVIFSIDQKTGKLTLVGHESTRGDWPRNFTLSPDGKLLLVANQNSGDVQSFKVNSTTGKLTYTGNSLKLKQPICLKFYPQ